MDFFRVTAKTTATECLRRLVPQAILDRGIDLEAEGAVTDCHRVGSKVQGSVREPAGSPQSVCLDLIAPGIVIPHCSCSVGKRGWCSHSVALFICAKEIDLLDDKGGFRADAASYYGSSPASPDNIAFVIEDLLRENLSREKLPPSASTGKRLRFELDLSGDRLGVRVLSQGKPLPPLVDGEFFSLSDKMVSNVLVAILNKEGDWDEESGIWYVSRSSVIACILGLLRECGTIRKVSFLGKRGEKLKFSPFKVDAVLECRWQSDGLHLEMKWVLGDERPIEYQTGIVGTNPYWCEIDNTIYELSNSAAKIASIFVHTSSITVPLEKCGPILEVLRRSEIESSSEIIVLNPEQMPKALVQDPKPVVEFVDISAIQEGKGERIELSATLSFQYTRKEGVVCLPNRAKEEEYEQRLKDLGFYYDPSKRVYVISGDDALDLIWDLRSTLGPQWKVQGLNLVRSTIRFAQLTLRLSISDTNTIEEDGFNCYVTLLQNGAMVPIGSLFKNAAPGAERWVKLDSGAYGRVPGGSLSELRAVLGSLSSTFWMANAIRVKVSSSQGISLRSLKGKPGIEVVASDAFEEALNKILSFRKIKRVPISKKFKGRLRQYQKEGFYWMHFLDELGFGGILADEMGLGKTVQALAHIQSLKDKGVGLPSLVVVPTSIITNWYYEARRFTPDLSVLVLHGPGRKKLFSKIDDYDLVLTTYALVRVDRSVFERHRFYLLVLDEAQNIKNEQASVSQSVKMIPSERRLALTGTPVENRPMDLWSIFDFLMPDYLGSKEYFRKNVEKVLITGGEAGNRVGEYLKRKVRPFILKRTKKEVEKDLPPKVESIVRVEMTPSQRVLYNEILGETRSKVFGEVKKRGIGGASMYILAALLRLRQICNHPRSVNGLQELGDLTSGKFEALKELVTEALESGKKILLYSQFLNMLSIIKDWLESQGVKYVYLDGSTKNRQDIVDAFNTDDSIRVFVISLKAGGFGLNLTAADTVMIYDPWWNPAVEQQASDRAHRIGQTKIVNVYRFVTENSVESHIMDLQERKEKIVDALIDPAASSPLKLSREDLEVIFEVG